MCKGRRESTKKVNPDRVRVAMVGAGGMANTVHYPSLASFADVEMVAICDLDSARMNVTADKYGIDRRYSDYKKMVEETAPDAVYVIGQPHLMYDLWMWCLGQGLNLYIEKPMGITLHQARALAYMAEKNGCITLTSLLSRKEKRSNLWRERKGSLLRILSLSATDLRTNGTTMNPYGASKA